METIEKNITMQEIITVVKDYYSLTEQDLLFHRRTPITPKARQLSMFLIKKLTAHTYTEIGYFFGGVGSHAVLYNIRRFPKTVRKGSEKEKEYNDIISKLLD